MQFHTHIFAESAWIYRLLRLGPRRISLTGAKVHIEGRFGIISQEIPVASINEVALQRSCFWRELTIDLVDGGEHSIGGLAEGEAANVRDVIFEESAKIAEYLGKRLKHLIKQLSAKRYIRHSDSLEIHEQLVSLVIEMRRCGKLVHERLDQDAEKALGRLVRLESVKVFERVRRHLNDLYVCRTLPSVKATAGADLTDEQAEAIATDEDTTLVLAGAGTGKTKVIVGKVEHLVRNQGVNPSEILVLAFNNKAADELQQRLLSKFPGIRASTFHSFGNSVVTSCTQKMLPISPLAVNPYALRNAVDDILVELLVDPSQKKATKRFILSNWTIYQSPFDFKNLTEYREHLGDTELIALSGDIVKSYEELTIANFLEMHGVEFIYEKPYRVHQCQHGESSNKNRLKFCHDCPFDKATATSQHRQYQPDFFLPEYDIYIEHFALDEKGRSPSGWESYTEGVEWKRKVHRQFGTVLLETFSWQYRKGILLPGLRKRLEEAGVRLERIPDNVLIDNLKKYLQSTRQAKLLVTFLDHVRGGNIKPAELRNRVGELKDQGQRRNMAFLDVFEQVRFRYEKLLEDENNIDFHDQINLATEHISQDHWESPFRYIMVDEFQDISKGRMRLLQSLMKRNVAYFLVGDDWQSIYRFAGSDVSLINNCGDYLGYVQEQTLTKTFRFKDGILGPSTKFIQRNKEQSRRELKSASSAEDGGITIVADNRAEDGIVWTLGDIQSKALESGPKPSVLVLGRYNSSKAMLPANRSTAFRSIDFSTVHKAKGREADYVIVLDLKNDRWGFPSKVEDDPLLNIVLPPLSGVAFPFAEERRLFYVATTRARIGTYLVTDSKQPSPFIEELKKYDDLCQVGKFAPKCPKCKLGVLIVIKGPFSVFMGCTEYRADPPCRYTRNIDLGPDDASDEDFWLRFSSEKHSM